MGEQKEKFEFMVSFSRTFVIEAEDEEKAEEKAWEELHERISNPNLGIHEVLDIAIRCLDDPSPPEE